MPHVMIVEDESVTAADLEQKLFQMGHEVSWFDSGEEALAYASDLSPDLVLMDIRLRGELDGLETARRLRARQDVPVVFITAFSDPTTVDRACDAQPYGYLLKPFTGPGVAAVVKTALARARAERSNTRAVQHSGDAGSTTLVAVDELSRRLAHEINNPLTYNLGALSLAQRELDQLRESSPHTDEARAPLRLLGQKVIRISEYLQSAEEGATRVAEVVRWLSPRGLPAQDPPLSAESSPSRSSRVTPVSSS